MLVLVEQPFVQRRGRLFPDFRNRLFNTISTHIKATQTRSCQVRPKHCPHAVCCERGGGRGARPHGPKFAVCKSILAKTHSAGVFFQRIAISRAICLLPQGPLSIEQILWSQLEITSNATALGGFVPPRKFISTMFFPILRLNKGPRPVWIKPVSLHRNIWNVVGGAPSPTRTHTHIHTRVPSPARQTHPQRLHIVLHLCSLLVDISAFVAPSSRWQPSVVLKHIALSASTTQPLFQLTLAHCNT